MFCGEISVRIRLLCGTRMFTKAHVSLSTHSGLDTTSWNHLHFPETNLFGSLQVKDSVVLGRYSIGCQLSVLLLVVTAMNSNFAYLLVCKIPGVLL
jgi:hypothetical protein